MAVFRPQYKAIVYKPRSQQADYATETEVMVPRAGALHSDPLQVATMVLPGFKPYLKHPTNGRRGKLDWKTKKTDIGPLTLFLLDPRIDETVGNASRWLSQYFGDAGGKPALGQCLVRVWESLDNGAHWQPFYTGRIQDVEQLERLEARLPLKDLASQLDQTLFLGDPPGNDGQTSDITYARRLPLSPWGLTAAFGDVPAATSVLFGEMDYEGGNNKYPHRVRLEGTSLHRRYANLTKAIDALVTASVAGSGVLLRILRFELGTLKMRISVGGVFVGWYWVRAIEVGFNDGHLQPRWYAIERAATLGDAAIPADSTSLRFQLFEHGPVTASSPILIDDVHIVQYLADLLDGKFGSLNDDDTPRYPVARVASSFTALLSDTTLPTVRDIISEPKPLKDVLSKALLQTTQLGLAFSGAGQVVLLDLRRPTSAVGLPTITDADLIGEPGNAETRYSVDDAITAARVRTVRYAQISLAEFEFENDDTQVPDPPAGGLTVEEVFETHLALGDSRTVDFGKKPVELDFGAFAAPFDRGGLKGDVIGNAFLARKSLVTRLVTDLFAVFDRGATYHVIQGRRVGELEEIEVGGRALLACANLLDPVTNLRGGTRLGICIDKQEDGVKATAIFVDMGVADVADVPVLAVPTVDADAALCRHQVHLPVTVNAAGDPVRVEFAVVDVGDPAPAEGSTEWRYFTTIEATTADLVVGPHASGTRIYFRARSYPTAASGLTLPSAWVFPDPAFLDVCSYPAPTGCSIVVTNGVRLFQWTNTDPTLPLELTIDGVAAATLDPGTSQTPLNNLPIGAGTVAVAYLDPFGGRSTGCSVAYTNTASVQAPRPAGLGVLDPSAIRLVLFPARDPAFPDVYFHWKVYRAPDGGTGLAPDLGAITTVEDDVDLGGEQALFDDVQPVTGSVLWYQVAHVLTGFLESDPTEWVRAVAKVGTPPAPSYIPVTVEEIVDESAGVGDVEVVVQDPQGHAQVVEFMERQGNGAWSAWTADPSVPYGESVTVPEGQTAQIAYRVLGYDAAGVPDQVLATGIITFGGVAASTDASFTTGEDETGTLPNSRQWVDRPGYVVDKTVAGEIGLDLEEHAGEVALQQLPVEWTVWSAGPGERGRITDVPAAEAEVDPEWRDWWVLDGFIQGRLVVEIVDPAPLGTIGKVIYSLNNGVSWADLGVEIPLHLAGTRKSDAWANLAALAVGDVLLSFATEGGDGATDCRLASIRVQFAAFADSVDPPPSSDTTFDETDLAYYFESFTGVTLAGSDATAVENQAGPNDLSSAGVLVENDATLGVDVFRFASGTHFSLPSGTHAARTAGHIFMLIRSDNQIAAPSGSGIWTYGPTHERYKSDVAGAADFSYGRPNTVFPQIDAFDITEWHLIEIESGTDYWAMRVTKAGVTTDIMELTSAMTPDWNSGAIEVGRSSGLNINGFYRMAVLGEFLGRQSAVNAEAFRQTLRDMFPLANL